MFFDTSAPLAYNNRLALARRLLRAEQPTHQAAGCQGAASGLTVIDKLRFNVAQLMKDAVGSYRHVEVVADLQELAPDLGIAESDQPSIVEGPIRMMHTNQGVFVQGELTGKTQLACARCLEPVPVDFEVHLEEVFVPTVDMATGKSLRPDEEDQALWIDEHHILDLTEVLRQDVLLELPVHVLCKQNCRGLCPDCGTNLNTATCNCGPDVDPRWASLTDLLKN